MQYWWVSHKRMFRRELSDGYIWCPDLRDEDPKRESWLVMRRVRAGDIIFSYADQQVLAIGVAATDAYRKKARDGYSGWWGDSGLEVAVNWTRLSTPFSPKRHIEEIRNLLPPKYSPLRPNGDGNVSYLHAIGSEFGRWLVDRSGMDVDATECEADLAEIDARPITETEKSELRQARKGQGVYRARVLKVEPACRITGVSNASFLIASHIKPWKKCDDFERLHRFNGLMLSPHIDRLFDRGWISFEDDGALIVHEDVKRLMSQWRLPIEKNVGEFHPDQKQYLHYHRSEVFASPRSLSGQ